MRKFNIKLTQGVIILSIICTFVVCTGNDVKAKEVKTPNLSNLSNLKIHKVLPLDAIPSIKNPEFVSASEAKIHTAEPVIGLSINGDSRAYSVYLLNSHEIVNDVIGGKPVAVTW